MIKPQITLLDEIVSKTYLHSTVKDSLRDLRHLSK